MHDAAPEHVANNAGSRLQDISQWCRPRRELAQVKGMDQHDLTQLCKNLNFHSEEQPSILKLLLLR